MWGGVGEQIKNMNHRRGCGAKFHALWLRGHPQAPVPVTYNPTSNCLYHTLIHSICSKIQLYNKKVLFLFFNFSSSLTAVNYLETNAELGVNET